MMKPLSAGDVCEVIGGLGRGKSPNICIQVTVASLQGEHSQHGRIWRCTGPNVKQLNDGGAYVVTGWADFAQSWLRKIEPATGVEAAEHSECEKIT